jgi:hypothetical protein
MVFPVLVIIWVIHVFIFFVRLGFNGVLDKKIEFLWASLIEMMDFYGLLKFSNRERHFFFIEESNVQVSIYIA